MSLYDVTVALFHCHCCMLLRLHVGRYRSQVMHQMFTDWCGCLMLLLILALTIVLLFWLFDMDATASGNNSVWLVFLALLFIYYLLCTYSAELRHWSKGARQRTINTAPVMRIRRKEALQIKHLEQADRDAIYMCGCGIAFMLMESPTQPAFVNAFSSQLFSVH